MSDDTAGFEREADEADRLDGIAEIADGIDEIDAQSSLDADLDLETPEADAAEQRIELLQHRDEPIIERPAGQVGEADPADIAEQRRVVDLDEDDYR